MLDTSLKEQLTQIFSGLEADYVFDITVHPQHDSRQELIELLEETAACSDRISCRVHEGEGLEFHLLKNEQDTRICFRAVPNGHEFSSLLLAVLNADGKGKNLPDEATQRRIKGLQGPVSITTYMSLSCTNCPDVVQALNVITWLNPNVSHLIVDGALFKEEVERLKIQAVPSVWVNGESFHIGRSSLGELLEKLESKVGTAPSSDAPSEAHRFDVLVAGGGPAGASAAIYSARKGLKVGVVAGRIGGQVNETVGIENLISVPYTTGQTLAADLHTHLSHHKNITIFDNRRIESFALQGAEKQLTVKGGETFLAPALIIATGASWRKLNVPGEAEYIGRGVAFCPHCDGPFYQGKHVAVIGGGNSGVEAAIDLAGICAKVTVLEFMENLKADQVLQDKLFSLPNVEVQTAVQTLEVQGNGEAMTALRIKHRQEGTESVLPLDGVFVQIGLAANSQPFAEALETNRIGEILVDKNCRTALPGVYAAGDVSDVSYKQIIISMGEGAKAALSAFEDKIKGVI